MSWYIGQDIVCIKTHSQGLVKEGMSFVIRDLKDTCCQQMIDVGMNTTYPFIVCAMCEGRVKSNGVIWFGQSLFAPLDSLSDISELLEIIEETITV